VVSGQAHHPDLSVQLERNIKFAAEIKLEKRSFIWQSRLEGKKAMCNIIESIGDVFYN
jgi:hypothetical protein